MTELSQSFRQETRHHGGEKILAETQQAFFSRWNQQLTTSISKLLLTSSSFSIIKKILPFGMIAGISQAALGKSHTDLQNHRAEASSKGRSQ